MVDSQEVVSWESDAHMRHEPWLPSDALRPIGNFVKEIPGAVLEFGARIALAAAFGTEDRIGQSRSSVVSSVVDSVERMRNDARNLPAALGADPSRIPPKQ